MGRILFWNIAGAGTEKLEDLSTSLLTLAAINKPDVVVVCEMRKLAKGDKAQLAFGDYVYVKPLRPQQTNPKSVKFYHGDTDKRLYAYALQPGAQVAHVATTNSRPVLLVAAKTKAILVMHAPSVSHTSLPQAEQMKAAYDECASWAGSGVLKQMPVAIFGDLNVNLWKSKRTDSLEKHLAGHTLGKWNWTKSGYGTHYNKKTGKWAELDWALSDPGFKCRVSVASTVAKKSSKSDDDMDWTGGEEGIAKNSDHLAMLLDW